MKKIYNICILFVSVVFISSCSEFLDTNPLDQISSPTFWTSDEEAEMALAGVYSRLNSSTFNYNQTLFDIMGGEAYGAENAARLANLIGIGEIEPTSGGWVDAVYTHCYRGISSCNFFLDNIDRTPIDESTRNQYKGEVLFLRALFYFTLTEFYGGVPLYTQPVSIEESKVHQASKQQVVNQVIADLDLAIEWLPNTLYDGHAVKGSAQALKAKVLLHNNDWQGALDVSNNIIQSGLFSLYPVYPDIFLNAGQENNSEILFSVKYLNPDNSIPQGPDVDFNWLGIVNPFRHYVDAFECIDGLSIDESPLYMGNLPDDNPELPVNWKINRDPRLTYTIKSWYDPIVPSPESGKEPWRNYNIKSFTDFVNNKGLNPDLVPIDYSTKSDQDWVILRYAEILLIYAEAKNEISGPDQSVYAAVNEVRQRPSVEMPPLPEGLTQAEMRERIRHERRVEFGFEGKRYFDIKRWGIAEEIIPQVIEPGGFSREFDPAKHYLFPFPQSEIDVNPELEQNPGY